MEQPPKVDLSKIKFDPASQIIVKCNTFSTTEYVSYNYVAYDENSKHVLVGEKEHSVSSGPEWQSDWDVSKWPVDKSIGRPSAEVLHEDDYIDRCLSAVDTWNRIWFCAPLDVTVGFHFLLWYLHRSPLICQKESCVHARLLGYNTPTRQVPVPGLIALCNIIKSTRMDRQHES